MVVVVVLLLVRLLLLPGAKCGRCFCRRTGKNNFLIGLDWVTLVVLPGALYCSGRQFSGMGKEGSQWVRYFGRGGGSGSRF